VTFQRKRMSDTPVAENSSQILADAPCSYFWKVPQKTIVPAGTIATGTVEDAGLVETDAAGTGGAATGAAPQAPSARASIKAERTPPSTFAGTAATYRPAAPSA